MTAVRHRPHGIEHPYATSPDQRVPVRPEAGETVRLGVVAAPEVGAVTCEWGTGDGPFTRIRLEPVAPASADAAALAGGEGHLAEAQAASLAADGTWSCTTPRLEAGVRYRYRFVAETPSGTETTGWYDVSPGTWNPDRGTLVVEEDVLVPGSVQWFADADGVHRVRFALRLAPGDHVVGFGERFDALDQRGRTLDAVVFEQYKGQGRHGRTYLPMPFAHVVPDDGSAGWGFHVRTSRRTWFDVGAADDGVLQVEAALGGATYETLDVATYHGTPTDVLDAFLAEVGRPEELPPWVFRL
ncbi:MAG: glycoside hydrolase family 31, partial [Actinomycetota bacterium]